jgi:hypothetical protein
MLRKEEGLPKKGESVLRCASRDFVAEPTLKLCCMPRRSKLACPCREPAMPAFKLCVAVRDLDGMLGEPVHAEIITAVDAYGAVEYARGVDLDMVRLKANALYVVDPNGHVVWSLRLADVLPQTA